MNVHEYQGKEILRKYGVATPRGVMKYKIESIKSNSPKRAAKKAS